MAEKILVVDDDLDTLRLVGLMLQRQGYQIVAASNGAQGVEKALSEKPDLILLDVMMPDMDGYEVTRRLRKNPITSTIPILMFTAKTQIDDKVTGFEVGADDYLTKPTHPTELQAHVRTLLARAPKKKTGEIKLPSAEQKGYVIGVISARGGLGVSTVASNLAAALLTRTQAQVVLAQLTPGLGSLGMDLGIPSQTALTEMLQTSIAEITREKVQTSLVSHNSGLKLLLASENPRDVNLTAQVKNFEAVVAQLSSLARFIVLDLGFGLPLYVQKLLLMCNQRVIVLEGTPSVIQHTKILLNELKELSVTPDTTSIILNNRQRSEAQMTANKVQEQLGHPIAATITPAPELFLQAMRVHSPAVISQPSSMTSQQFLKIADSIIQREKAR